MPITLGILAQSRQVVAAGAFDLLETQVLGSDQASVTFSGLSAYASTYKHLQVRATGRTSLTSAGNSGMLFRFNGDAGNNYSWHRIEGTGSSVVSSAVASTNGAFAIHFPRSSAPANIFSGGVVDILDAFSTSKNTTLRSLNGVPHTQNVIALQSAVWLNTSSLTSMNIIDADAGNIVTGSRISLYGVK